MINLLAIPFMAFLNRFRGGGFGAQILPGHPRFYVSPVVGLVAGLVAWDWQRGLICGACYLTWSFLPWGHLECLGHYDPPRPLSWLEARCLNAAFGHYMPALALLHAVGLLPAMFLVSPLAVVMPPLVALSYAIGWASSPKAPILTAELLVGALWGTIFVL